ncbi:protein disulfide oxidoreductase DsbA [Enterobacterales bacterium CwR94]|nr:protein disulfide oxidoreductase DsbA [Enterobacterales bacterium CwR94]
MFLLRKYVIKPWLVLSFLATTLFATQTLAKPYSTLSPAVADAPEVVEFFSFYCGPCYLFTREYPVIDEIKRVLPAGGILTRYHVSAMGKLGHELSEAWAVASVMGVADNVEQPLFLLAKGKGKLNTSQDIMAVMSASGISPEEYESARNSILVQAFIARQEAMAGAFDVRGTPSIYVNGKYLIDNGAVAANTSKDYATAYAGLVSELLKH